jgi:putative addiction module component (TIGR02574 family)
MDRPILEKEAMKLPVHERALLAETLLNSLDPTSEHEIEAKWAAVAEDRSRNYDAGKIEAVDGPGAIDKLRENFQK